MSPPSSAEIPEALVGQRLDRVVSMVTGLPRAEAAGLVTGGAVRVGGDPATRGSRRMALGEVVEITTTPGEAAPPAPDPSVPLHVVHEDRELVVVDKPAGLVVHPGAGNRGGTLVNGLLARYPEMARVGDPERPGIVHRLDKGTSGLLVVARTSGAYAALVAMLAGRQVSRAYLVLVAGAVESDRGVVDAPVGRSARQPTRMAVTAGGRGARTRYEVRRRFPPTSEGRSLTLLECSLETGRTHQIRVHLAAIGHPVAGDPAYGRGGAAALLPGLARPFLHAHRLAFEHPAGTGRLELSSPLPADLEAVLDPLG
ncbi:MAG TPA: RluA family pseudouridine synthase [Acidimicrobiales bacterium]|nr:RluA family pseudouridine synthase [Acidimicrobiales bacterium]